jgi:hypothetical protein
LFSIRNKEGEGGGGPNHPWLGSPKKKKTKKKKQLEAAKRARRDRTQAETDANDEDDPNARRLKPTTSAALYREVRVGLDRIVSLCYRSFTLYRTCSEDRRLNF